MSTPGCRSCTFPIKAQQNTTLPSSRINSAVLPSELAGSASTLVDWEYSPGLPPFSTIPVVRTTELSRFQLSLWKSVSSTGSGLNPYYKPEAWVAHITLAREIGRRTFSKAIGGLSRKEIELELEIDKLAIIEVDGEAHRGRSKDRESGV